jgi:hypothetical protein
MQTMRVQIEEGVKAFRVNGVTVAKRHLVATLANDTGGDLEKMLVKYLVIVPFLAKAFTPHPDATESIKYGAFKAKRLYQALGITEENTLPFMLGALAQAGDLSIEEMGKAVRNAGYYDNGEISMPFSEGNESTTNSLSFPHSKKPTLH